MNFDYIREDYKTAAGVGVFEIRDEPAQNETRDSFFISVKPKAAVQPVFSRSLSTSKKNSGVGDKGDLHRDLHGHDLVRKLARLLGRGAPFLNEQIGGQSNGNGRCE